MYAYPGRQYSTPAPPTEKGSAAPDSTLPVTSRSKKQKVDLHPAPVRPKAVATPGGAPKAGKSAAGSAADGSGPATVASSSASLASNGEGVITQAKQDIEDAAQHGILKPPPENANRLMKLWHQAKELFVCATHALCKHPLNLKSEILC